MGVDLTAKREEIRKILAEFLGRVEVEPDGSFSFAFGSTRVYVGVGPFAESATVVSVYAITNGDVPPSPELFEFVATKSDAFVFGHLGARVENGKVFVMFRHTILGDFLQPEELKSALGAVASTADQIDDEIKAKFGGRIYGEATPPPPQTKQTDSPAAPAPSPEPAASAQPVASQTSADSEETDGYL